MAELRVELNIPPFPKTAATTSLCKWSELLPVLRAQTAAMGTGSISASPGYSVLIVGDYQM